MCRSRTFCPQGDRLREDHRSIRERRSAQAPPWPPSAHRSAEESIPSPDVPRHPDDQVAALSRDRRSASPRAAPVGGPLPSHKCAMPAKHGLRPYEQSGPSRLREVNSQSSHDHSISWRPVHPLDLSLQNLDLPAERQHISLEFVLTVAAACKDIQQDKKKRVDQRSQHAGRNPSSAERSGAQLPSPPATRRNFRNPHKSSHHAGAKS